MRILKRVDIQIYVFYLRLRLAKLGQINDESAMAQVEVVGRYVTRGLE